MEMNVNLYTVNCNIYILIFYAQIIETIEHWMYTHTLDKSPGIDKPFNLYANKSEVSISCITDIMHNIKYFTLLILQIDAQVKMAQKELKKVQDYCANG